MRSFSLWTCALLFVVSGALKASGQLSVTMPYKNVTVENVDGAAMFSGAFTYGEAGQPSLPAYKVSFLLPPDADFRSVRVLLDNVSEDTLSDSFMVHPKEAPSPEYIARKGLKLVDGKDMKIYGKDEFFPADYKSKISFGMMWQYKIVDVIIYPFLYNPRTNKLRTITGGTLSVSLGKGSKPGPNLKRRGRSEQSLRTQIVNSADLEQYGNQPEPTVLSQNEASQSLQSLHGETYMIVTTNYIVSHSTKLSSYISSLTSRGAVVYTITENQLGSSTGQAKADAIRNYLIGNWVTDVVLIGNPDPDNGDVPMARDSLTRNIPTDYYYADIVYDTFPDAYAEQNVGRIPVYQTMSGQPANIDSLDKILTKGIHYDSLTSNQAEWRRFGMLPDVPYGWDPDGYKAIGEAVKDSLSKAGWSYYRLYEPYCYNTDNLPGTLKSEIVNMSVHPEEYFCNYNNVLTAWKRLKPGLVVWGTHGGSKVADHILDASGQSIYPQVSQLNDSFPAMVFAASCATADPTNQSSSEKGCLAYQTVLANAISYIGATLDAYGPEPLANFYVAAQKNDFNFTCAEALNKAKQSLIFYDNDRNNVLLFNLYGFPDACLNLNPLGWGGIPQLDTVRPGQSDPKTKIKLVWHSLSGATSYIIERGDSNATRISGFSFRATVAGGSSTNYVDSNPALPYNTKFKYRIYAVNASGRSGYSIIDSAKTYNSSGQSPYPAIPINVTAKGDRSNGDTLKWSSAGAGVGYIVKRSTNSGGPFYPIAATTALTFKDTNLINGTPYYYVVSSVNPAGQSAHSSVCSATPAVHILTPTINGIVMNVQNPPYVDKPNEVAVSWTPNPVNTFYPLGYILQYIERYPDSSWDTSFYSINPAASFTRASAPYGYWATTTINNNLCGNSTYKFRMSAFSGSASSAPSTPIQASTASTEFPPPSVSGFFGFQIYPEIVYIQWIWDSTIAGNQVFYKASGGKWTIQENYSGSSNYAEVHIGANKTFQYYVRTYKLFSGIRVYSNFCGPITVTTNASLCTPSIDVNYFTDRKVVININDLSISDTSCSIERKTGSGGSFTPIGKVHEPYGSSYKDSGSLSSGQTYYYRVRGFIGTNYSAFSDTVCVTTCTNIAIGKTATASSTTSPYTASKAVDNDSTSDASRWAAATTIPPTATWKVDLGAVDSISSFGIVWRIAGTWRYFIYGSDGNTDTSNINNWFLLRDTSATTPTTQTHYYDLGWNPTYRYIKTVVTKTPSGVKPGFYEFRVFGKQ